MFPPDDKGKDRLVRSAAAMANAGGGFIVFGVADRGSGADRACGMPADAEMGAWLASQLKRADPPIPHTLTNPPIPVAGRPCHLRTGGSLRTCAACGLRGPLLRAVGWRYGPTDFYARPQAAHGCRHGGPRAQRDQEASVRVLATARLGPGPRRLGVDRRVRSGRHAKAEGCRPGVVDTSCDLHPPADAEGSHLRHASALRRGNPISTRRYARQRDVRQRRYPGSRRCRACRIRRGPPHARARRTHRGTSALGCSRSCFTSLRKKGDRRPPMPFSSSSRSASTRRSARPRSRGRTPPDGLSTSGAAQGAVGNGLLAAWTLWKRGSWVFTSRRR
jgi:hypothetical protein